MEHLVTGAYKRLAVSEGGQLYYLFEDGNTRRASPALIPLPYQAPSFDGFLAPTLPDLLGRGITRALYRAHHLSLWSPSGSNTSDTHGTHAKATSVREGAASRQKLITLEFRFETAATVVTVVSSDWHFRRSVLQQTACPPSGHGGELAGEVAVAHDISITRL
jgi:hypothetical protein